MSADKREATSNLKIEFVGLDVPKINQMIEKATGIVENIRLMQQFAVIITILSFISVFLWIHFTTFEEGGKEDHSPLLS